MPSITAFFAPLITSVCLAAPPGEASDAVSTADNVFSVTASSKGLIETLKIAVEDGRSAKKLQRELRPFSQPSNGKEASSQTIATRLHRAIPKEKIPELKNGDLITMGPSGIQCQKAKPAGSKPVSLLSFVDDTEIKIIPKPNSGPALKPTTGKPTSPLVEPDPDKKIPARKFSFDPQKLRDPQNQRASYEDFRDDLQAAKDAGLTREQVVKEFFGNPHLNRMFTYSDGFAKTHVKGAEAELRKLDGTRWQQIAAFCSVFGPDTKLTGASKPFEGFTAEGTQCLPDEAKLRENHTDALDVFFPKKSLKPDMFALQGGVVVAAGDNWTKEKGGGLGGNSGNGVIIATPMFDKNRLTGITLTHVYHLDWVKVAVGDIVNPGTLLGQGGTTGTNAAKSKPHVHIVVQVITAAGHDNVDCQKIFDYLKGRTSIPAIFKAHANPTQAALDPDTVRISSEADFASDGTVVR